MVHKSLRIFRNHFTCLLIAASFNSTTVHAAAYAPGTFTFKPINVNMASLTMGLEAKDSFIVSEGINFLNPAAPVNMRVPVNVYRSPMPFGFNECDRNAIGYGVEMGYVIGRDVEVFGRAGYSHERPKARFIVADRSFEFKPRNNYGLSLGARYYINLESAWKPFLSVSAGYTSQGETKAQIYAHSPLALSNIEFDQSIGIYKLLKQQNLFSFELSAGTDYAFNKNWALSCSVALRYNKRGGSSSINTPGALSTVPGVPFPVQLPPRVVSYSDHKQQWYIPVTVSLKFMF
jgi:opacity protein-like surface antigen